MLPPTRPASCCRPCRRTASAISGDTTQCTVSGTFNKDGWDWIGTVSCPKLVNRNINTQFYKLESAVAPGTPVGIAVDNCD